MLGGLIAVAYILKGLIIHKKEKLKSLEADAAKRVAKTAPAKAAPKRKPAKRGKK
ncbi:hypothetical protein JXB02_04775 [Candidatus Woesearchaeota archaeon]|nr:hypothetical protein [Candidatus Woesearchaeota archaeon]